MKKARLALFSMVAVGVALLVKPPGQLGWPATPNSEQINRWIAQLGDDNFNVREQASKKLW